MNNETKRKKTVVALGMFDGVHIGHRALIERTKARAREIGGVSGIFTFSNHPGAVLGSPTELISDPKERRAILLDCGVDALTMVPFTRDVADTEPEAFIRLLTERFELAGVVVGFNYTFGRHGSGTPALLCSEGRRYGFFTDVVAPVLFENEPVSSTRIRNAIREGSIEAANAMLGRCFSLSGTVIRNRAIGRTIGFPTANIAVPEHRVLPADGVYAAECVTRRGTFRAVTNIGTNPTVNGRMRTIETHLIGFSGDLYGETITVSLLKRLRGEAKFADLEALRQRIAADIEAVRTL